MSEEQRVAAPPLSSEACEHLELASAHVRALLALLPPLAAGPARVALEQIRRAQTLAELGSEPPLALDMVPLADLAALLKRRREAAGMSQLKLAERASLAPKTIRNLEEARHRPSQDTIGRLLAVAELGLIASDLLITGEETEQANSYLLPSYDRKRLLDEMIEVLDSPGGALEQTSLYLDDQSAADWMALSGSQSFVAQFRAMPLDLMAERIAAVAGGRGLDVNALGCGDGRNEVRLTEELCARRGGADLRLNLLDISHTLLTAAYQHATERLAQHGVEIKTLHGDFHRLAQYRMLLPRAERMNRRRIYVMLGGTLANLDNEVAFFRDALSLAAPGDLCLLDFQIGYASPDKPEEIRRLDPPLAHGPPERHKAWFTGPIRRYCQNLKSYEVRAELNVQCPVRGSYEINCHAQVERGNGQKQRYLLYRVRRYTPTDLQHCMEGFGWRILLTRTYGPGDHAAVMLMERRLT